MAARNAREGVKKIRCDDSDGSSGAESVDVAHTRLLLREVGSNSKVPNDRQSHSHCHCHACAMLVTHSIMLHRQRLIPAVTNCASADVVE